MVVKVLFSFAFGQAIFWRFGYDQIGIMMQPKVQLGFGQRLAEWVYDRIPHTTQAAWTLKALEILTDAGKIPIEGAIFRKHGFAPDALAVAATQPLFSAIETAEKIAGAALYPQRVHTPEQMKVSIGCIYGSVFRYAMTAVLWKIGPKTYNIFGRPAELRLAQILKSMVVRR